MEDNNKKKTNTLIIERQTETQFLMHQTQEQRNNQQAMLTEFPVPIHFTENINKPTNIS